MSPAVVATVEDTSKADRFRADEAQDESRFSLSAIDSDSTSGHSKVSSQSIRDSHPKCTSTYSAPQQAEVFHSPPAMSVSTTEPPLCVMSCSSCGKFLSEPPNLNQLLKTPPRIVLKVVCQLCRESFEGDYTLECGVERIQKEAIEDSTISPAAARSISEIGIFSDEMLQTLGPAGLSTGSAAEHRDAANLTRSQFHEGFPPMPSEWSELNQDAVGCFSLELNQGDLEYLAATTPGLFQATT